MAERKSWVERQQRLVRCKIHGLHYDPQLTSGCAKCRKSALPQRRSPQLAILLLLTLGIVFVGLQLLTPWLRPTEAAPPGEPARAESTAERAPSRPPRLDPERYRPAIEALEAVLFRPQTPDVEEIANQAATAGSRLSADLQQARDELASQAAAAVNALTEDWRTSLASARDVEQARSRWLESRARFFEAAPWLSRSLSGDAPNERLSLLAYRNFAASVDELILEAQEQISVQHDAVPLAEAPADRAARLESQRRWWGDWRQRLSALSERSPERPSARAGAPLLEAVVELEQALTRLSQLAADPDLGQSSDVSVSLGDLSSRMATITRNLDDLLVA